MELRNHDIVRIIAIGFAVLALVCAGYALGQDDSESARREARHAEQAQLAEQAEQAAVAEQLMQEARAALNRERYAEAAELMHEVQRASREARYAGNAMYWEAFARYRLQRLQELKRAVALLERQLEEYPDVETARDAETLRARLYAEMAERGQIEGITEIEKISEQDRIRQETRIQALHALMQMNPERAMPLLEDIVRGKTDDPVEIRRNALFVLCRLDDERSTDLLIDMLHTTEEPELLTEIIMCLSRQDSDRALDAIIELFETSQDRQVDEAAMFAIGRNGGDRAFELLAGIARTPDKSGDLRAQAMFGLAHSGRDEETAKLAAELLRTESDREVLEAALFSLSRLEGDLPDTVLRDLVNNPAADDDLRAQALHFMARRQDMPLTSLLELYRSSDNAELKLQVCHVISTRDSDEALDALIAIARQEDDPEIRQNILFWIGRYDNDKAADFLMEVIREG
jgi:hypothetical protein